MTVFRSNTVQQVEKEFKSQHSCDQTCPIFTDSYVHIVLGRGWW